MRYLLPLTILLAACGQEIACPDCKGDGKERCAMVGLNGQYVKCVNGTVRCDPSVHKPIGPTEFCTTCQGSDGQEHDTCGRDGILDTACPKCDGSGKVKQ